MIRWLVVGFVVLNCTLWLTMHSIQEAEWWDAYPFRCEACKTLVDTSVAALAREDAGDAAFTARSFRSFEFCNTHRYDRFFRRLAYAHHVDDEARSDLIKACHMLLHERKRATPVIRHQLEEQLVSSNLPRALASIGVRDGMRGGRSADSHGRGGMMPSAPESDAPYSEEQLRREEQLAIEAEQRRIRHQVCLGTHACPSTSVLATTELRAFIYDLEGAAHAELKPMERHDTEQEHADEPSGAPSHRLSDDTL